MDNITEGKLRLARTIIKNSSYKQHKEPDQTAKVLIEYYIESGCSVSEVVDTEQTAVCQRVLARITATEHGESFPEDSKVVGIEVVTADIEFLNYFNSACDISKDNLDRVVEENSEYIMGSSETLARFFLTRTLQDTLLAGLPIPTAALKNSKEEQSS